MEFLFLFLVSRFKLGVYISIEDDNRLINENEVQRFQYIDDMDIQNYIWSHK